MPPLSEIIAFLEAFAPPELAEEWDNVGLLIGDRAREVGRILTCLTLTPDVAREAIDERAALVVTHHPVLFRPVKRLTADDPQGKMLLELIAAGIAVYCPHTSYDSADAGINRQLAELLELQNVAPLRPVAGPALCKIVCFVPRENLARVQEALWGSGAGIIGEYSKCSFMLDGTGSFLGSDASSPAIGTAGQFETVAEARLELVCPEKRVPQALQALRGAHPYEEPAIDVYPLKSEASRRGAGRMGTLPGSGMRLGELVSRIKSRLKLEGLACVGDLECQVSRVGICCGSGGELLPAAIAARCDAFLTGEATFHTSLSAQGSGIALLLAGHYATERPAMEGLAEVLAGRFAGVTAWGSRVERDPVQWVC